MEKFVEVRKLVASKNDKLLKWLPSFAIKWVEKVIHQDEVNDFMHKTAGYDSFDFSKAVIDRFNLQVKVTGKEYIPELAESCVFVSNHPLGGLDAITIIHEFREVRPDIKFVVNDLLMGVRNLADKFIGVNKVGKNAVTSLQKVEEQFASDTATFIFPAGLVSRKVGGKIEDLEWKKTFISKAKKYKKSVIPIYIDGKLTNRFYRLANIRKALGLKFNIEMFYLVDELFRQKNAKIDIMIGQPIAPSTFDKSKSDKQWAQWVKKETYKLAKA